MLRLDRVEEIFFTEGPDTLRQIAFAFVFIGCAGGLAIVFNMRGGFDPRYLWFAGIGLVPGSLCWLLSKAVRARHIATVPLTLALCALALFLIPTDPSSAATGITPYMPVLIGVWVAVIFEYLAVAVVLAFMFRLRRKGAFA